MEAVSMREILQWTDAQLVGILNLAQSVTGISTDSREIESGELFLALKGLNFDGHKFVEAALEKGACAAVVEREWAADREIEGPLLIVPSALEALGAIARQYRRRFQLPVVGVVGSAGKTTTKEMIAAVLGRRYRVLKNQGNENNEIGVPKTLLQLEQTDEAVVLELAARKRGDISYLCSVAQPTIGVLLNIGTAHLEFFESVEGVAKAKGELLDYLDESLTALVNVDDCVAAKEAKRTKGRLLGFGLGHGSQYRGEGLVLDQEGRGHFSLQNFSFQLQIPGRHNAYNALAAAAVGGLLDVPWEDIQSALNDFQPVAMRSQILRKNGICIINDSYNANPDSVRMALDLLSSMEGERRIAVLGDMLELGPRSAELHADVGCQVAAAEIDLLLATGPLSAHTVKAAQEAGLPSVCARHFADREALAECLVTVRQRGDLVLVKASRSMGLETIVERITR